MPTLVPRKPSLLDEISRRPSGGPRRSRYTSHEVTAARAGRLKKISFYALALAILLAPQIQAQQPTDKAAIATLTRDIPSLMQQADIPGLSIALVDKDRTTWIQSFGTTGLPDNQPIDQHTRFSAASLSKTVFAYAVLQLVDQGKLDLDTPLTHYWPADSPYPVDPPDDPRLQKITARLVLSHRTGFPNWRPNDPGPLKILLTPGERFSYSGEGFVYLQRTVERIEGKPLNQIMQQLVFTPLHMNDSTYISEPDPNITPGHSPGGQPKNPFREKGNAASSLLTTAHDYALFLEAILSGRNLKPATLRQMETPQIAVDPSCTNCTDRPAPAKLSTDLFWGLGWGIEQTSTGKYLWHWGDNPGYKAFVSIDLNHHRALVVFTNSQNGLSIAPSIVHDALGGDHPAFQWIKYDTYDSPTVRFIHDIVHTGARALTTHATELQNHLLSEDTLEIAGYILLYEQKKNDDAIAVFTRNVELYPDNGNAIASLGEGYMVSGNKARALECYEQALKLVPNSNFVKSQIAKLRANDPQKEAAH